jgi:protein-L-isoaspartate(D-aspartate) O-methyltransferase
MHWLARSICSKLQQRYIPEQRMKQTVGLLCWLLCSGCIAATDEVDVQDLQARLVTEIDDDTRRTAGYTGRSSLHPRVRDAMTTVARHHFVDTYGADAAYANQPLPIGHGQTISQPFIVALMTDLLDPQDDHSVLEIGTGSGYQAAVLATLVKHVFSIEIIPELAASAQQRLIELGYDNVSVQAGDGYFGWPEQAPFDGIIVTAVGPDIPTALVEQLKIGGRMVLPVGTQYTGQNLSVVTKQEDGSYTTEQVLPVAFVPLTGNH